MGWLRAECIKAAAVLVPITPERKLYRAFERENGPIPVAFTRQEAALAHEKYGMPPPDCWEQRSLTELLSDLEEEEELAINPATECLFVKRSYYTEALLRGEEISQGKISKWLKGESL